MTTNGSRIFLAGDDTPFLIASPPELVVAAIEGSDSSDRFIHFAGDQGANGADCWIDPRAIVAVVPAPETADVTREDEDDEACD